MNISRFWWFLQLLIYHPGRCFQFEQQIWKLHSYSTYTLVRIWTFSTCNENVRHCFLKLRELELEERERESVWGRKKEGRAGLPGGIVPFVQKWGVLTLSIWVFAVQWDTGGATKNGAWVAWTFAWRPVWLVDLDTWSERETVTNAGEAHGITILAK